MTVGNVALGSEHPIRIQTMTTSDTKDVAATVEEVLLTPIFAFLCTIRNIFPFNTVNSLDPLVDHL